jgi:type IV fimbrial biogenesis protein FimT
MCEAVHAGNDVSIDNWLTLPLPYGREWFFMKIIEEYGLSLVELMIVIAVLGIISSVAAGCNHKWRDSAIKSKGFTLIEMVIVIAVMAILAAIAAPNYNSFMARKRVDGAANQLFTDLMGARMQAISQNNKVIAEITSSTGYNIVRDLNGNGVVDTGETGSAKSILPNYYDVTITVTFNPVFNPNGTASNPTITVSNSSATKTITISTAGRIKVS